MGPRGRRAGFRSRGSFSSRGFRGNKRGSSRFGPRKRFDADRVADKDEQADDDPQTDSDGDLDEISDGAESGDDPADDENVSSRPYVELMRSFHGSEEPQVKRRKTQHSDAAISHSDRGLQEQAEVGEGAVELEDVDEAEEDGGDEDEEALSVLDGEDDGDSDSDNGEAAADPFDLHFAHPNESDVARAVKNIKDGDWSSQRVMAQPLRATLLSPGSGSHMQTPPPTPDLASLRLKQKLQAPARKMMSTLTDMQRAFMPYLFDYRDVLYCGRTVENSEAIRQSVCLHALNHVFKTRDRIIKNNYKLSRAGEKEELEFRDQGFSRPKVLFLLPTRNSCARMMNVILDLCQPEQQENRKRFEESYIDKDSKFGEGRPADFKDLFEGNDDDMFRLGLKFTRKTIKYFSPFYSSDIILASPLGLRMAIGSDEDKKKADFDFLSSIEVVIVDQADALLMQNWEHVEYIFEHVNQQPKDAHGCDFSRVRSWYLEDWASFFRQTIILSAFNTPELSELQRLHCLNWAGKARLQPEYQGVIQQLGVKVKQTFCRFQPSAVGNDPDARFDYFVSAVVPTLVKRAKDSVGTLLFIPSYLDFVRVRNYFANAPAMSSITFGAVSEYTDVAEASRARSYFLSGRQRVMLYTERSHHFRRYQFRGVQRVIFFGLPDNPLFYREIAGGFLSKSEQDLRLEPGQGTVRVLFSKYDLMKLERIVGSVRVGKMIQERGDTFDFL